MPEFDIVVYGATGFTGQLVAKHLNTSAAAFSAKWAIAGRSAAKLEELRAALADGGNMPAALLVVAADDAAALDAMCVRTKVVIACAGPFILHGKGVVAACARTGTHYCDIAGEPHYVRHVIRAHDAAAQKSGACIVPNAGFDCVPSDVLNMFALRVAAKRLAEGRAAGEAVTGVEVAFAMGKSGVTHGTMQAVLTRFETASADDLHPMSLAPKASWAGVATPNTTRLGYNAALGGWTAPFVMAGINQRVVRRSNALNGVSSSYHEKIAAPFGRALLATCMHYVMLTFAFAGVRALVRKHAMPPAGGGPSADVLANGRFAATALVHTTAQRAAPIKVGLRYEHGDAYAFTAVAACEVALALAAGEHAGRAGVVTPAVAVGEPLIKRLTAAGMVFEESA
jgi:short subunit dehydrogenase-like uncharacterized protein